ncbi:protein turtle homolog B-like isoform X2 [Tachypleus tridentatus]|uniref:protein turtle homolog B-like isoform X2 n=1 Tax=Tachypleus tridentatus TaxID=6853 RepID=UPI003FCF7A71
MYRNILMCLLLLRKINASILYTAVVGGKVALPCDISSPAVNDSPALILWYKGESAQPIYTLDARKDRINQARQSVSPQLQNRAYFNMINRPAFLQLDPVRLGDAGEYRCRIDFHKARTINTVITLKIIVPPADPLVLNEEGKEVRGTIGPYNEGETVKLLCKSIGGKPRPSVTWWKEDVLLDDSYTFKPKDVVDNELTITKVKREDLMSVLTCKASNSNITVPGTVSVTLDLNLKPKTVKIQSLKRPLSANKEVELRCSSSGSRPAADITWWKGNEELQTTGLTVDKAGVRTGMLKFTPSITDDGKYLSCRAENSFIPSNAVEDGWRLEVYYNPQLSLELGARIKKDNVKEGDDVYFECHIRSNPWVTQVFWHFEGQSLTSNSSIGIIITNQTLVIQRIRREHRGRYSCSAQNVEGLGVSNEIFLKVKYAPQCSPIQKYTYGVAINEVVEILCQLDADPSDITFHWRLSNTTSKHSDAIQYTSNQAESVATYTPQKEEDFGNLFCWGANDIGIQKSPCIFSIVSAGPPNPLQNCFVLNQTENQITIECMEQHNTEITDEFSLEVYSVEDNRLQANLTSKFPRFQIRDLPEGTHFRLLVYAWNAKGKSDVVVISAHTHKPADKLTDNGNTEEVIVRPLLIALIGVVGVLVVVAVAIVILNKYRSRRERKAGQTRRSHPDKSQTPLWKDISDLSELDDKGPDIIPAQTLSRSNYGEFPFIMGEDDKRRKKSISLISPMETFYGSSSLLEGTSLSKEVCYDISSPIESVSVQPLVLLKKQEDTSYEGLASTVTTHCSEEVMSNESGPECSKTGFRRPLSDRDEEECGVTCETPLMESRQESAV